MTTTVRAGDTTSPAPGPAPSSSSACRTTAGSTRMSLAHLPATPIAPAPDLSQRLTENQLKVLFSALRDDRVGFNPKGFAHVQQWDVRRFLIRVFGFGGYDTELLSIDLVREIEHPPSGQGGRSRWTVVYRVHQRLTVKDIYGRPIASFEGVATGAAQNQPSLADAHDGAVKEADSQSLKRAAVNLGDAFGLSLYNGGQTRPVVIWSAAHTKPTEKLETPPDEPVLPEPDSTHTDPDTGEAEQPAAPAASGQGGTSDAALAAASAASGHPQVEAAARAEAARREERDQAWQEMHEAAREADFVEQLPAQFEASFGHPIEQGTTAEYRQARDLMRQSTASS